VAVDGSAAAVCDGASDAAYSRLWASVLVQRFVEEPTVDIDSQWLQVAVSRFERSLDYLSMPWHLLERTLRGSYATLAGAVFRNESGVFDVVGIGDSSIAWVNMTDKGMFPLQAPEEFSDRTYLVSTVCECNRSMADFVCIKRCIPLPKGDTYVFLMTDAVGHWYAREIAEGRQPWRAFLSLKSQAAFEDWLADERANGLRNDDATIVALRATA